MQQHWITRTTQVLGLVALLAGRAQGQSSHGIELLGTLPGTTHSRALDISDDGSVIVGSSWVPGGGVTRPFAWTRAGGLQDLGDLPGGVPVGGGASAISGDGMVVVGFSSGRAFRWTALAGMQDLGTLMGVGVSRAVGVSADGSVVVGVSSTISSQHAFLWTAAGGMQDLGALPGHMQSEAHAVSADGRTVVGRSRAPTGLWLAFKWTVAGGIQDLGLLPGHTQARSAATATAVSANGQVVVGSCTTYTSTPPVTRAFRWTQATGMVDINTSGGNFYLSFAKAVSDDGEVVIGTIYDDLTYTRAFRWTSERGLEDLGSMTFRGSDGLGCSASGRLVVGTDGFIAARWPEPRDSVFCSQAAQGPCTPGLQYWGAASLHSGRPFELRLHDAPRSDFALLAYSIGPPTRLPGRWGMQCVGVFPQFIGPLPSNGNAGAGPCSGQFEAELNTHLHANPAVVAGTLLVCQFLYRDPAAQSGAAWSKAVLLQICP